MVKFGTVIILYTSVFVTQTMTLSLKGASDLEVFLYI